MILVDVKVPSVEKSYDFRLNENVAIRTIIETISEMIEQLEHSKWRGDKNDLLLCRYDSNAILSKELTLAECGVASGDRLILV
jgi:uncharacterized ubiquitin-like protein YukD